MRSAALQRTGVLAGVGATLLAMVSVQSGAAIAITLFASVGPVAVVALRVVTASGFLVSTARPPSAPLRTPMVATLAGYGLVIAGMNCCFYLAIKRVPLGVAVALEMVGAGACWGGYSLLSAQPARRLPGAQGLALAMTIAAVPVTLIALAGSGADLLSPRVLAIGAAVGLLSTALPGTLDAIALRRLRSVTYALVLSLSPAVAALSGFAIRGQHLAAVTVIAPKLSPT